LLVCLALVGRGAAAEPRRVVVDTPPEAFTRPQAAGTPYLYLNRCVGGCSIIGASMNDAAQGMTTIPAAGSYTVAEFTSVTGQTGAAADDEWNQVVQCMREVYSPYAIELGDTPPSDGRPYNMAVIAGRPQDVGLGSDILGIAPLAGDCSAQQNVISMTFANYHGTTDRVLNVCWTAAQESAHAYGLDHEYQFTDGESACSDPTTYQFDCGGEKFFRNRRASCGEKTARKCRCSSTQNSHQKLFSTFGPGTPITPPPHATIVYPTPDAVVSTGWVVHVSAGSKRGIAKVELYLNGSRWAVLPGQGFGPAGQLDPSTYTFYVPNNVPDGLIDVSARAYDDLGLNVQTDTVLVQKGAPCTSATQCLNDQSCNDGRCAWGPPTGELGDSCSYDQFCTSWMCIGDSGGKYCTVDCVTDEPGSCPSGFSCVPTASTGTNGVCLPDGGGCCSVGGVGGRGIWGHAALSVLVLTWLRRRRR